MKLLLRAVLVFICGYSYAQPDGPWVIEENNPDKLFSTYQAEFENYWSNKTPTKGQGFKQFKRWEAFWETRLTKEGKLPSPDRMGRLVESYLKEQSHTLSQKSAAVWTNLGPYNYTLTDSWSAGQGRINAVAVDPIDPSILYVGAPAGGIWKSTDSGQTWANLNDDMNVIGVSGIAIDPTDTDVIYISTGDDDANDTYSIGVFKSIDGGLTWNATGLSFGSVATTHMVLDPVNTNTLFVGSNQGVFKTIDGAATFTNVLNANIIDIAMHPTNNQIIYACSDSEFYRSSNGGASFSQITSGLPTTDIGRIGIAVTPGNGNYVYLLMARDNNDFKGLYRSTNGGADFTLRNDTDNIFDGSGQAWYDMAIAADAENPEIVYTGLLNVWKSSNGGSDFNPVNSWSAPASASYTHADIHFLASFGNKTYCGSDGGVYVSDNQANTFTDISNGLSISQIYRLDGIESNQDALVIGLQDNGGLYTTTGVNGWQSFYGADGMEVAIKPNDENIVYGMIQNGSMYVSNDAGLTVSNIGRPEGGAWITPMKIDPNNYNRILAGYSQLYEYVAGNWNSLTSVVSGGDLRHIAIAETNSDVIWFSNNSNLYMTTNGGGNAVVVSNLPSSPVTDIEINHLDEDIVYVSLGGFGSGEKIFKTTDGGITWIDISTGLPDAPLNCIELKDNSNGVIYGGTDFGVYYYDELLEEWIDYSQGLPRVPVRDMVINETNSLLRIATYGRGVWETPLNTIGTNSEDLFLAELNNPIGQICASTFIPEIRVKNVGTTTVTSYTIEYGLGNYANTFNWTGSLASFDDEVITLNSITATNGTSDFQVRVINPNGAPDDDFSNNEIIETVNVITNSTIIDLNILTDCWGSETTWEIKSNTGTSIKTGGPYANAATMITETICLEPGCYELIFNDSYGDGMTSNACAEGSYGITDDLGADLVVMATADFGFTVTEPFCVGANAISANFEANSTSICEGSSVDFTNTSSANATAWSWTFVGGTPSVSTDENPTNITYTTPGSYEVTLVVDDGAGNSSTQILPNYITVNANLLGTNTVITNEALGNDGAIDLTVTATSAPFTYLWSNNAITEDISGLTAGDYTVTITDDFGCELTETFNVANTVGIGEAYLNLFNLYPNPTNGNVTLVLSDSDVNSEFSIYSIDGKLVLSGALENTSSKQIDLSPFAQGIYSIEVKVGDVFARKRIVKR